MATKLIIMKMLPLGVFVLSVLNGTLVPMQITKVRSLLFISGAPIKIDGGCSYFATRETPFSSQRVQLVIDSHHRAFIEYEPYKYAFFKRISRKIINAGYEDYYKGEIKGFFVLKIDSINSYNEFSTFRKGILRLSYSGLSQTIGIQGVVEDNDSYNKSLLKSK